MTDAIKEAAPGDAVSEFYTRHPYPPPVDNLDRARDAWRDARRHRAEYHLIWPDRPYRADLDILVAGCGTWQAAKYAVCRPAARIVGIDVSTTSLDHTERLKRQYHLTNLETRLLSIEDVEALPWRFDLIVCTGVLHHLADPDTGLRALRAVLRPTGAMVLMVYAPYGRAGVHMLQEYCRLLGVGTSPEEIHDLAAVVQTLPQDHPLTALLRRSRDAGNADALADALLNPRERSYSVPELFDFTERNGLRFGRWSTQAPYLPQCGAIANTLHAQRLIALPPRDQYAAMELWRSTIACHSLIVHRNDMTDTGLSIRADAEHWPRYVPFRLPSTVCMQERLPSGAAAVLLNRAHAYPDLILLIDAREKRLFDAIDGHRTIAEIIHHARRDGPCSDADAQIFFEKLWRFDQVVFDASRA